VRNTVFFCLLILLVLYLGLSLGHPLEAIPEDFLVVLVDDLFSLLEVRVNLFYLVALLFVAISIFSSVVVTDPSIALVRASAATISAWAPS
jgi:hypothetical protein